MPKYILLIRYHHRPHTSRQGILVLAKVHSCAVIGLDTEPIHIEVDITSGIEKVTIISLPDIVLHENSERVRSANSNSGFFFSSIVSLSA